MKSIYQQFFDAFLSSGERTVFKEDIPTEMILSEVDKEGYFEWQAIEGTLTMEDYHQLEREYQVTLPTTFINWHKSYFFLDGDNRLIRLPESLPNLQSLKNHFDQPFPLIEAGYIPFADDSNDTGLLVFDTNNPIDREDFPIRLYDLDYEEIDEGLSEITFSSFSKLLECLTYFLVETKANHKKDYEAIEAFLEIDPEGAGGTGRNYWESMIADYKGHEAWEIHEEGRHQRILDLLNKAKQSEIKLADWKEELSLPINDILTIKRKLTAELHEHSTDADLMKMLHWIVVQ